MLLQFSSKQFEMIGQQHYTQQVIKLLNIASQTPEDEALMKAKIWEQAVVAQSHGFLDERSVSVFVLCAWWLGIGFDRHIPIIKQILHTTELDQKQKIQALENFTQAVFLTFHRLPLDGQEKKND